MPDVNHCRRRRRFRNAVPLLALLGAAFAAGAVATSTAEAVARKNPYAKLDIFARVLSYVENSYVDEVEEPRLMVGAIRGMLATLDPHTQYLPPEEYADMKEETSGEFGGIGIEVAVKDGMLTVVAPLEDTPAWRSGIQSGDVILAIDGESTRDMALPTAVSRMRGLQGTKITLQILREGWSEPREFVVVRDRIRIVSAEAHTLEPGYGYVRLKNFQQSTAKQLTRKIEELTSRDGGALKGLVLDLRDNPGGLLDEAVKVADEFLSEGLIVYTEGRHARHAEKEFARPKGTQPQFPLITLVNGGSASASEIVAGALQDHGRAVVMGTRTFGKGSIQTVIELDDGSALKLTIARYFTPKGRSIQEKGIEPDVTVERDTGGAPDAEQGVMREADLENHLAPPEPPAHSGDARPAASTGGPDVAADNQLRTALNYLKSWEIFRAAQLREK